MAGLVTRRTQLPADHRTPAAARAVVRAAIAEAALPELLDEALLLTTELSTNGVVHAGTEIELDVLADSEGLTVTVTDFAPGPAPERADWARTAQAALRQASHPLAGPADLSEHGRGLALVDHFATSWGVIRRPAGKGVWFRLDRGGTGTGTGASGGPAGTVPRHGAPSPAELARLAGPVPAGVDPATGGHPELVPHVLSGWLLSRACAIAGAQGGQVLLDRGDGQGAATVAEVGQPGPSGADPGSRNPSPTGPGEVRAALPLSRPWRGDLVLYTAAAPGPYAQVVAQLAADRLGLTLENDRLRDADLRRRSWLTFLAEASELLAQSLDVDLTMALIPRLLVPRLGQWCAVYAVDDWDQPRLASATHVDETALADLLEQIAATGRQPAPQHQGDTRVSVRRPAPADTWAPTAPMGRLREAVRTGATVPLPAPVDGFALPLIARSQRLGVLAVGRHWDHRQDPAELAILEDLTRRAALALDNARIHAERRRIAQTLQQSLLPPVLPRVAGLAFGAEYVPTVGDAAVGGDFYDVVAMPDGRWLLVIGDVSGKGVQAATVTGLVRDVVRILVREGKPLPEMLVRINETLVERGAGRYCTLAIAAVAPPVTGPAEVELYLSGHDRPLLVDADGKTDFVGTPGTALGLLPDVATPGTTVLLGPGATLVFCTDGVTDRRRGGDMYGLGRWQAAAGPLAGYAVDVVAARLRAAVLGFSTEPPRDDIAILALRNDIAP